VFGADTLYKVQARRRKGGEQGGEHKAKNRLTVKGLGGGGISLPGEEDDSKGGVEKEGAKFKGEEFWGKGGAR